MTLWSKFRQVWVTETGPRLSVGLLSFWPLRSWQTTTTPEQWTGGGWASSCTRCLWERLVTCIQFPHCALGAIFQFVCVCNSNHQVARLSFGFYEVVVKWVKVEQLQVLLISEEANTVKTRQAKNVKTWYCLKLSLVGFWISFSFIIFDMDTISNW